MKAGDLVDYEKLEDWQIDLNIMARFSFSEILKFSTDRNACALAWGRLTEGQKHAVVRGQSWMSTDLPFEEDASDYCNGMIVALDAAPRQLCEWMLEALDD